MEQGTSSDKVHEYCPYGGLTRAITKRLGGSFQYAKSTTLGVVLCREANDTFSADKEKGCRSEEKENWDVCWQEQPGHVPQRATRAQSASSACTWTKSTSPFRKKTHSGREPHHPGHPHNANVSKPKLLHFQTKTFAFADRKPKIWPYPTMPHADRNWMKQWGRITSNSGSNTSTLRGMMGSGMVTGHLCLEDYIVPYKVTTWIQNWLVKTEKDQLTRDWITHCLTRKLAAFLTDWLIN